MIKYLHEIKGEFPVSIDIKIGYRHGRWGAIAFLPDISVRCSKLESFSALNRFCLACIAPHVHAPEAREKYTSELFTEINRIIADEDPQQHIMN